MNMGADIFGIASALVGVALVALLVGHASQTSQIVQTSGNTFNELLQTVTLQNSGIGSISTPMM